MRPWQCLRIQRQVCAKWEIKGVQRCYYLYLHLYKQQNHLYLCFSRAWSCVVGKSWKCQVTFFSLKKITPVKANLNDCTQALLSKEDSTTVGSLFWLFGKMDVLVVFDIWSIFVTSLWLVLWSALVTFLVGISNTTMITERKFSMYIIIPDLIPIHSFIQEKYSVT